MAELLSVFVYLPMLMSNCYCVPESYGISGHFRYESVLNTTGQGYGTLRQPDTGNFGTKWNSTVQGGAVVNYNDVFIGGKSSVNRVVENNSKPNVTYDSQLVFGDDAKRLAQSYGANVSVTPTNGAYKFSCLCGMPLIASVIILIKRI